MSTIIAGTDSGTSITRYARPDGSGYGYQVTWGEGLTNFVAFDNEDTARAFYHLLFLRIV